MRNIIKDIILEFHQSDFPTIISRDVDIPQLPESIRKAFVFIGMRRSGKTYLMYQRMHNLVTNGLDKTKILYMNFEDDRLAGFDSTDFQSILDVYFELYPNMTKARDLHFFLDEIQNIENWELFIRRLLDKEHMSIFITGSSATLLSKEIASSLRGRCLSTEVFPLKLTEYLSYKGISNLTNLSSKEKSIIRHHTNTYLQRGGFPETLELPEELHKKTIQSYIDAAVFRDVIERYRLKNPHIIKVFLLHCLQNIGSPLSITKIHKTLKSRAETVGRNSLYEYFSYFEDAYLICNVPIYDFSTRKRQVNPSKIYCIDPGIIGAYSIKPHTEDASRLENAVYLCLRYNFENIFYYKTKNNKEIDFIAQSINGEIQVIQVCVDLRNENTKKREIDAIIEAAKELEIKEAIIITSDESEMITLENLSIKIIPYWEFSITINKILK
jgi:uncharacterized protein